MHEKSVFHLGSAPMAKTSYRGANQFLHDRSNYPISLGTAASVVDDASDRAAPVNAACELSGIRQSAADSVFHCHQPILITIDTPCRFCALLAKKAHRGVDSWGVHLHWLESIGFQRPRKQHSPPTGSRRSNFACCAVETPDRQGARRANSQPI